MDNTILETIAAAVERFPRIAGILLGITLHPLFSAMINR